MCIIMFFGQSQFWCPVSLHRARISQVCPDFLISLGVGKELIRTLPHLFLTLTWPRPRVVFFGTSTSSSLWHIQTIFQSRDGIICATSTQEIKAKCIWKWNEFSKNIKRFYANIILADWLVRFIYILHAFFHSNSSNDFYLHRSALA